MSTVQNNRQKNLSTNILSVGDSDPFESQSLELQYANCTRLAMPVDTLFYDGTHHLHHQLSDSP